jgi:glycosyltransferase involved in cell wall biosynthesis
VAPVVSILIPTCNGAEHLEACLQSARNQSYADLEIVVVDDASDDTSFEMARRAAAEDERIKLHRNGTRLGLAGNWNRCLQLAQGEWIKFLFQDDLLHPDCLERLLPAGARDRPLVTGRRQLVIETGTDDDTKEYFGGLPNLESLFAHKAFVPPELLCKALVEHLATNFVGEPTAVLLHRSVFERFGTFNPEMIQLLDLELWARIGVHTGLCVVRETVATFRLHPRSQSAENKRAQEYRKNLLDPLILYHQYAHDDGFAPLRRVAASMQPPVSFAKVTAVEAERAHRMATQDASLLQAWNEVSAAYPRLRRSPRLWWLRLRQALGLSPRGQSRTGSPPGRRPPPPATPGPSCS